ncbi:hypothetical protein [Actinacidiphila glaucinigra]|uniref:hypothetical protein n=1 Tax=Actinacidiphila glaucinigra TaxID=235986 RepID=UPI00366D6C36
MAFERHIAAHLEALIGIGQRDHLGVANVGLTGARGVGPASARTALQDATAVAIGSR